MSISVNKLTKIYGTQKAVNGISFSAAKGEIVGFLGPNGAGKSTTMKILTGYLEADAGTAQVCGQTVSKGNLKTKALIGYLPESNPLYYDMYVREYLHFMADVHQLADAATKVAEVINKVGLTPEANKRIGQLSKGYKQRVGLAAALIHNPEVLVLDEPTTGLDPNQIIEIRAVIKQLGQNKTVLFSSHILQEVEAICNRVIIINKGNIVADDTLANLQKGSSAGQTITVSFDKPVDANLLQSMPYTDSCHALNTATYQLHTPQPELVKRALLQLAITAQLNIVSLQSSSSSLEDIFRELTGGNKVG
jgi:ABC-2 type transport system ATP-binding protein